jgi:hypothetical protein
MSIDKIMAEHEKKANLGDANPFKEEVVVIESIEQLQKEAERYERQHTTYPVPAQPDFVQIRDAQELGQQPRITY